MKHALILSRMVAVCALLAATTASGAQVWIEWTPNGESDLAGYRVYRTTTTNPPLYPDHFIAQVTTPSFQDSNNLEGQVCYYWVAAVDQSGNESEACGPLQFAPGSQAGNPEPLAVTFQINHLDENQDPADPFVDRTLDSDSLIAFSWDPNFGQGATYRIFLSSNSGPYEFMSQNDQPIYQLALAQAGSIYCLRVDVTNSVGLLVARGYSEEIRCETGMADLLAPQRPEAIWLK
jgi:hypothetical protein